MNEAKSDERWSVQSPSTFGLMTVQASGYDLEITGWVPLEGDAEAGT